MHELSAPYHPESIGMAERLLCSLKYRLIYVNKDQGFSLKWNLNIAVSTYCMRPHCATRSSLFVLLYVHEAVTPYEVLFNSYASEEQYQGALSSHTEKMFEIHKGDFFSNHKYQLK